MSAEPVSVTCSNPDCRVAESGKCVEGVALDKCSHYGQTLVVAAAALSDAAPESTALGAGERIDMGGAHEVLRERLSRVVAVLGPSDAGKTSLIACLIGLFQDGTIGQFAFGGSRTLRAFEQVCHDSRAASNREIPSHEHTPRGQLGFFHLAIADVEGRTLTNLLLGDRAGEEYLELADNVSAAKGLAEIVRADNITVLVDGKRLLDISARHNVRSEVTMMLQALWDGDALNDNQRLGLVLTKYDEIQRSPDRDRAMRDFELICKNARELFGGSFLSIDEFRVAASPTSDALPRGHGIAELLTRWMSAPAQRQCVRSAPAPSVRAFARLMP